MNLVERIAERDVTIAIVGLGYVGLPLAVEHAKAGQRVWGIDVNAARVERVNGGASHVSDVPDADLAEAVKTGRLRATTSFEVVKECDVVTICVPTPLDAHKDPDTGYIVRAVDACLPFLRPGQLMILESTTYPGTTEELLVPRIASRGLAPGRDVHVAFSPERIDPGNPRFRVRDIPKVVGGLTPACTEATAKVYETTFGSPAHRVSSPRVAETTKLLENIFRIVNVSLVNELAMLCDRMGVDIWEVVEAAKTKPFGFMPFYPGPGMGGHCIPVDAFYLSWKAREYGFTTRFIELAGEINDGMPDYVARSVMDALNAQGKPIKGARVLLVGIAYKRDIGDLRESPALVVADELRRRGAHVSYHDPHIPAARLAGQETSSVPLTPETLRACDVAVVLADHTSVDYDLVAAHAPLVYDTRNAVRKPLSDRFHKLGASALHGGPRHAHE